jgi:DNA-binding NarL/FixJ family response regulator
VPRGARRPGISADNAAIAQRLVITERAIAKHTASIFLRLGLQPSDDDNRRVLAVLAYLGR